MRHCISFFILALLAFSPVCAQENIKTDKPDQTDGTDIVSRKSLQLENAYYFHGFSDHGPSHIITSLFRYGLSKNFEARFAFEQGSRRNEFITEAAASTYPVSVGFKWSLVDEQKIMPAISLITYMQVPITNSQKEPDNWSPTFLLALQKEISDFSITVNGGAGQLAYEKQWEWHFSGDIKYEVSRHIDIFSEYFAHYEHHNEPMHNLDAGILYFFNPNIMVHLSAGTTLLHHPSNYFVSSGVSLKLF